MALSRTWIYALSWIALGGILRLYRLDAMEFKRDEQEALVLAAQLVTQPPWTTGGHWPAHGMVSSNFVFNAPLFTWITACFWFLTNNPIGVAALIALVNTACLIPLWFWARRVMDDQRALLTVAITAVSPFAVLFSRKIWTQDLLFTGLIAILWGIEWLRDRRPWRGVALLLVGLLLAGQLHQSGLIGVALLPIALAAQFVVDARQGKHLALGRPSTPQVTLLIIALALNLFFWLPYLRYLMTVPMAVLGHRPMADSFAPTLLVKLAYQIAPADVTRFFWFDRGEFTHALPRWTIFRLSILLGAPLCLYGLWRWARAPFSIPVAGVWWWLLILTFAIGRIETHFFYTLVLTPLPALIAAGAFDPAGLTASGLRVWRWTYVVTLLALSIVVLTWITSRGGSGGDYGVSYYIRNAQAAALVAAARGEPQDVKKFGRVQPSEDIALHCALPPSEVTWLADRLSPGLEPATLQGLQLCDEWVPVQGDRVYRWDIRR